MECLIVTGGCIDRDFACEVIKTGGYEIIIAADSGIDFFYEAAIMPDIILGDFDSVDEKKLAYFRSQEFVEISALNAEKDDTDTEFAVREAIRKGATSITILGATGSRLDHVLGNIAILGIGLEEGLNIQLLDPNNRIRMFDHTVSLRKQEQYGKYVSVIPFSDVVTGVTLTGVKYPLKDYRLGGFNSLGVSNEITEEEAIFAFEKGIILLIESRD